MTTDASQRIPESAVPDPQLVRDIAEELRHAIAWMSACVAREKSASYRKGYETRIRAATQALSKWSGA